MAAPDGSVKVFVMRWFPAFRIFRALALFRFQINRLIIILISK